MSANKDSEHGGEDPADAIARIEVYVRHADAPKTKWGGVLAAILASATILLPFAIAYWEYRQAKELKTRTDITTLISELGNKASRHRAAIRLSAFGAEPIPILLREFTTTENDDYRSAVQEALAAIYLSLNSLERSKLQGQIADRARRLLQMKQRNEIGADHVVKVIRKIGRLARASSSDAGLRQHVVALFGELQENATSDDIVSALKEEVKLLKR